MAELLEEWFDTILYLVLLFGASLFFACFWSEQIQNECAETVVQEFLTEASIDGKITAENYQKMVRSFRKMYPDCEVDVKLEHNELQPVYAVFSKEEIAEYYLKRNVKKEKKVSAPEISIIEQNPEELVFQSETNATIMAAKHQNYIPLPQEESTPEIKAVRPFQEVYTGEELITLCCISNSVGNYYAEAEMTTAEHSGVMYLKLMLNGQSYEIPVEVKCHPRIVLCENGHEVVNTKEIISYFQTWESVLCPYCAFLPKNIICNSPVIYRKTGSSPTDDIWIEVEYLNGETCKVTPESEEWMDTYDENYCGIQQVEISYRGVRTYVTIVSENDVCKQCKGACNDRCNEDYRAFPYCSMCMSKIPLFTGKTYEEEQKMENSELITYLETMGEILMEKGDTIIFYATADRKYLMLQQKKVLRAGK